MDNKQLKTLLGSIIPYLSEHRYKGQNGKIAIVGGSFEYTGAPYYAAISTIRGSHFQNYLNYNKGGGDLCHIFCTSQSAIPIKSYSPECIVHPLLLSSQESNYDEETINKKTKQLIQWLPTMHSLVIGPGLGRDPLTERQLIQILLESNKIIKVLDADALWYFDAIYNFKRYLIQPDNKLINIVRDLASDTVITPNAVEMKRFQQYFRIKPIEISESEYNQFDPDTSTPFKEVNIDTPIVQAAVQISQKLNNVCVIQKGIVDVITNGKRVFIVFSSGSMKRCGGIGDILSGLTGLYAYWASQVSQDQILLGCLMASIMTRRASRIASEKYQFSLACPNIIDNIGEAFREFSQSFSAKL